MSDSSQRLTIEDHGRVRVMRMSRPPVNALDPAMLAALADAIGEAPAAGVGALVLTGSERIFTGGLDLMWLVGLDEAGLGEALGRFFDTMAAFAESRLPIAAAIRGHSPAGGAVLAMLCDRRVMAAGDGRIGLNEVRIGIPLPTAVARLAARTVGARRGEALCVEGRLLPAAEALAIGLVDEVVAPDAVLERALAWCNDVIASPAVGLEETRRACRADLVELLHASRAADMTTLAAAWASPAVQAPLRETLARLRGA